MHSAPFTFELIPNKVSVKIYTRDFKKSTHYYDLKNSSIEEVTQNYRIIEEDNKASAKGDRPRMLTLNQIHSPIVTEVTSPWEIGQEPESDGMFSHLSNMVLGVKTADCVPVLIASSDGGYIGALHCGWQSSFAGIIENFANLATKRGAKDLKAVIGPCILQESYEVGQEFYNKWMAKDSAFAGFFKAVNSLKRAEAKFLCDLPGITRHILAQNNIETIHHFKEDTFAHPERYPSNRFCVVHNLGKYKGSILSTIIKK